MVSSNEILIRLLLGTLIGGIIGYERQIHGRPAGLRTHILVCTASVLLMIVSEYFYYPGSTDSTPVSIDPGRIAAGAITGVGFIGAGVVLKTGLTIQGLTTAASIWVISAIGLALGAGLYTAGLVTSLITIATLTTLRIAERKMSKLSSRFLTVTVDETAREEDIVSLISKTGLKIDNTDYESFPDAQKTVFHFTVTLYREESIRSLFAELSSMKPVKRVSIKSREEKTNE
jgi:putative Mg2+ transporter-C (MgtC) family protein